MKASRLSGAFSEVTFTRPPTPQKKKIQPLSSTTRFTSTIQFWLGILRPTRDEQGLATLLIVISIHLGLSHFGPKSKQLCKESPSSMSHYTQRDRPHTPTATAIATTTARVTLTTSGPLEQAITAPKRRATLNLMTATVIIISLVRAMAITKIVRGLQLMNQTTYMAPRICPGQIEHMATRNMLVPGRDVTSGSRDRCEYVLS